MTDKRYAFAQQIVKEAGAFLRQHMDDELVVEAKTDFTDLVTNLDRQIQEQLAQKILSRYPEDQIFGEECESRPPLEKGRVWVIDPIDGTTNFIVQQHDFAILLKYNENQHQQNA